MKFTSGKTVKALIIVFMFLFSSFESRRLKRKTTNFIVDTIKSVGDYFKSTFIYDLIRGFMDAIDVLYSSSEESVIKNITDTKDKCTLASLHEIYKKKQNPAGLTIGNLSLSQESATKTLKLFQRLKNIPLNQSLTVEPEDYNVMMQYNLIHTWMTPKRGEILDNLIKTFNQAIQNSNQVRNTSIWEVIFSHFVALFDIGKQILECATAAVKELPFGDQIFSFVINIIPNAFSYGGAILYGVGKIFAAVYNLITVGNSENGVLYYLGSIFGNIMKVVLVFYGVYDFVKSKVNQFIS